MACNVVYKGKEYTFAEFATALHDGLLEDLSKQGILEGVAAPSMTSVKNVETGKLRDKYGLPPIEKQISMSNKEMSSIAQDIVENNPYEALKIINDVGDGNRVAGRIDQYIFAHYIASIEAKLENGITNELLNELNRVTKIAKQQAGRIVAQSLQARSGMVMIEDSLGTFLQDMREYLGAELSKEEQEYVNQFYEKYKKLKESSTKEQSELEYAAMIDKARSEFEVLKKEVEELKKQIEDAEKGGKNASRRKEQADNIRKKFKSKAKAFTLKDKDGNDVIIGGETITVTDKDTKVNGITQDALVEMVAKAWEQYGVIEDAVAEVVKQVKDTDWYKKLSKDGEKQFKDIVESVITGKENYDSLINEIKDSIQQNGLESYVAKKIKKAVTLLVSDGNESLKDISQKISKDLGGVISSDDVISVMGGKYNPVATKGSLDAKMNQMRTYAKLLTKLKDLQDGTYIPNGGKKELKVRQEIEAVRSQIEEIERANGISANKSLDRKLSIADSKINEIREKIKNKDYSEPIKHSLLNDPIVREKFPDKIKSVQEKLRQLRALKLEFEVQKQSFLEENRSTAEKTIDGFAKTYNTIGKMSGTLDLSFMGVHSFFVLYTNPKAWTKGLIEGVKLAVSREKFKESIEVLRNDTIYWDTIEGSGLDIMDIDALKEAQRDDQLRRTWFDEHTVAGKKVNIGKYIGTEASDRAFVAMGNVIRLKLFDNFTEDLYKQGKTIYTHPEEFKAAAKYVNNMTGRGKVSKEVNSEIVKFFIWSPSKLAARLSMLGLSDLVHVIPDIKGREEAKRLGKEYESKGFYASLDGRMRKQAAYDAGKIIAGGLAVMAAASLAGADVDYEPESPTFGFISFPNGWQFQPFGEAGAVVRLVLKVLGYKKMNQRTSAEEVTRFIRGKFHPIPRIATDLGYGKSFMGTYTRDIDGSINEEWLLNAVGPMSIISIVEGMQEDPLNSAFLIPFQMTGLPMSSEIIYSKNYIENYYENERRRRMKEPEEKEKEKIFRKEQKMKLRELMEKYPRE